MDCIIDLTAFNHQYYVMTRSDDKKCLAVKMFFVSDLMIVEREREIKILAVLWPRDMTDFTLLPDQLLFALHDTLTTSVMSLTSPPYALHPPSLVTIRLILCSLTHIWRKTRQHFLHKIWRNTVFYDVVIFKFQF